MCDEVGNGSYNNFEIHMVIHMISYIGTATDWVTRGHLNIKIIFLSRSVIARIIILFNI